MSSAFTTIFRQTAPYGSEPCLDATNVARAITAVFAISPESGQLTVRLPAPTQPACVDNDFRDFASRLLQILPGLPFFVFGGSSPQARDLFFGMLANASAAADAAGIVRVQFSLEEAHSLLHSQYEALLKHGVSDNDAVEQFSLLAAQLCMTAAEWK